MDLNQQQVVILITITLAVIGIISAILFRLGIPRRPDWLPGFVFVAAMLAVATSTFLTLFYDQHASVIQGVTLVAMTVCVSLDTKSSAHGNAF